MSLVPGSLVLPISVPHHDRVVRELHITASASSPCCHWLRARSPSCDPRLFCSDWRLSSSHCCSFQPRCVSSCERTDGFERAEKDTDVRKSDPEVPSSSSSSYSPYSSYSSSLSEDETRGKFPPAVKLRSEEQRPPWRYWRRTGPEPQHRQPGGKQTLTTELN